MRSLPYLFSLSLAAALLLASCRCPPDEKIGEIGLGENARSFFPYEGTETLTFQNAQGATVTFSAPRGREEGTDQVCINTICTEARYNSPSSCEYFESDNIRYIWVSDDKQRLIDLLLFTEVYEQETENFYDALQVSFASGAPSVEAYYLLQQRFSGDLKIDNTSLDPIMSLQESVDIQNQTFTNVLRYRGNNLGIYLQAGKGVIAFEESGNFWLLQE